MDETGFSPPFMLCPFTSFLAAVHQIESSSMALPHPSPNIATPLVLDLSASRLHFRVSQDLVQRMVTSKGLNLAVRFCKSRKLWLSELLFHL